MSVFISDMCTYIKNLVQMNINVQEPYRLVTLLLYLLRRHLQHTELLLKVTHGWTNTVINKI